MSDTIPDPDLEARVRRAMHSLADAHQPSPRGEPGSPRADGAPRRTWLIAAAMLLVVGGVVAVFVVSGRDTSPPSVATEPSVSLPSEPGDPRAADGDVAIDPGVLRFSEPLPDGSVAFVNDTSLRAPSIAERGAVDALPERGRVGSDPGPDPDSIRVIVMDGSRLLMRGIIVDVPADTDLDRPLGPPVDIGVDGATYIDADEGAIVIPIDDARRIVGPDEIFMFGSGGPYIEPDALIEIASAVGQLPFDHVARLPGFFVHQRSVGGETIDPLGRAAAVRVEHRDALASDGSTELTLYRLAEPPTAVELLAIAHALLGPGGTLDDAAVGDVALTAGGTVHLELVSPVDLVIMSASADLDQRIESIDFTTAADLDAAFDGSVTAPPRTSP